MDCIIKEAWNQCLTKTAAVLNLKTMKLYKNKIYNRLYYIVMAIVFFISLVLPVYKDTDIVTAVISISAVFIVAGVGIYRIYKQSFIPLFEITNDVLIINDIRLGKKEIYRDSIAGITKNKIFGYKILTSSDTISIPLGSLNKTDREIFLSTLKLKI